MEQIGWWITALNVCFSINAKSKINQEIVYQ